ncbi:hypothetical protein Tco_1152183 [Tanacetum coccineum]
MYGKACHLLIEMEHKAYWVLKNVNLYLDTVGKHWYLQLNKLTELRNEAYEHSRAYKERTKRWHDAKIIDKEFQEGGEVLVFNSRTVEVRAGLVFIVRVVIVFVLVLRVVIDVVVVVAVAAAVKAVGVTGYHFEFHCL